MITKLHTRTGRLIPYDLDAPWTASNQTFSNTQVLDTVAEGVRVGSLTVVETSTGTVKIVSNELELTGSASYTTTGITGEAVTKSLGKALFCSLNYSGTSLNLIAFHITAALATTPTYYFRTSGTAMGVSGSKVGGAVYAAVATTAVSTDYKLLLLLGGSDSNGVAFKTGDTVADFKYGVRYYIKGGTFTDWTLLCISTNGNTATLYPIMEEYRAANSFITDNILIPTTVLNVDTMFQPNFLDTFSGTNDDSLTANHTPEVVGGATGTGNPWESGSTTWTIQSNTANNDPSLAAEEAAGNLVAGIWYVITATEVDTFFTGCAVGDYFKALATTGLDAANKVQALTTNEVHTTDDLSLNQGIFDIDLTVGADNEQAGLVLCSDSASDPQNYIEAYYDNVDTQVRLVKVVAGTPTELIDANAAYSAGATLRAIVDYVTATDDVKVKIYYNGALIDSEQTIEDNGIAGNTRHGIMSVDSSNSLDNFTVHNRTDSNWDAEITSATGNVY